MNIPSRFMPSTFFPFINIITNGTVSLALAALESTEDSSKLFIHLQFSPTRVKLFYLKASTCCNTLNWLWAIKVSISFIQLRRKPVWNYFSFPSFFRTTSKSESRNSVLKWKFSQFDFLVFLSFPVPSRAGKEQTYFHHQKSMKIQVGENVSAFPRIFICGRSTFLCVCYTFLSPFQVRLMT